MYWKLAIQNICRSLRDYIIYFVTLTLTAALMYSFLAFGLFIRCSCYGRKYVDADYWNFAYVSSGCFSVLVCDRLCDPLYAGRSLQPTN